MPSNNIKPYLTFILLLMTLSTLAQYQEPMTHHLTLKNMNEYGLVNDNAKNDQTEIIQKAIDDLHAQGGGQLIISKGSYKFANIYLKSNIHLLIDKGTVIKPHWPEGSKTTVFILDTKTPEEKDFIRNVSIKGKGGRWAIDYSGRTPVKEESIRGVLCGMAKNFCISDMDIKDNFTANSGITLAATTSKTKDLTNWEVSRATDGLIRNCSIFNASPGYGLAELQGALRVHFENLYANGGVTLRFETKDLGAHNAVFDITAKDIVNENGRSAVMFQPYSANNGIVTVENVKSIGSTYAIEMDTGKIEKKDLERNPNATSGSFADGTSIKNIHAIFGKQAQIKKDWFLEIPKAYLDSLKLWNDDKFMDGPSIAPIKDYREEEYHVIIENITSKGFKYYSEKKIITPTDIKSGNWSKAFSKWLKSKIGTDNWRIDKGPLLD